MSEYRSVDMRDELQRFWTEEEEFSSVPMGKEYRREYERVNEVLRGLIRKFLLKHPEGLTRNDLKIHFAGHCRALTPNPTGGMVGAIVDEMLKDGELTKMGTRETVLEVDQAGPSSLYVPFFDEVYRLSFTSWVEEIA
jgi:hypothetical protein